MYTCTYAHIYMCIYVVYLLTYVKDIGKSTKELSCCRELVEHPIHVLRVCRGEGRRDSSLLKVTPEISSSLL